MRCICRYYIISYLGNVYSLLFAMAGRQFQMPKADDRVQNINLEDYCNSWTVFFESCGCGLKGGAGLTMVGKCRHRHFTCGPFGLTKSYWEGCGKPKSKDALCVYLS